MKTKLILFVSILCSLAGIKTAKLFSQGTITHNQNKLWLDIYADNKKNLSFDYHHPAGEIRFNTQEEKSSFGVCFNNQNLTKKWPVSFRTGNLTTGGSLSKLNNPLLSSTVSPFSTGTSEITGITTSLPGSTFFSKPVSHFFQAGIKNNKNVISELRINGLYTPDDELLVFSSLINFNYPEKRIKLAASITSGFFPYQENKLSTWFTDESYYHKGNHLCSLYQLSFKFSGFTSIYTAGLYETPFGNLSSLYRIDNKLNTSHFIFNLSGAYNPNYDTNTIITSSEKQLNNCLQLRGGLQYKIRTGKKSPLFVKAGFQNYLCYNFSKNEHPAKLSTGLQLTNGFYSLSCSINTNLLLNTELINSVASSLDSWSFQIKNSLYGDYFAPSLLCNISLNPSADNSDTTITQKYLLSMDYSKHYKLNSNCSITLSSKNNQFISRKMAATVSVKYSLKYMNIILKFSADNTF